MKRSEAIEFSQQLPYTGIRNERNKNGKITENITWDKPVKKDTNRVQFEYSTNNKTVFTDWVKLND